MTGGRAGASAGSGPDPAARSDRDGAGSGSDGTGSGSDPATAVERAIEAMRGGEPVLVHDAADREGETDLIYHADAVTPDAVARMRNDAGGLICAALAHDVAEAFELPFLADAVDHPATGDHELGYGDRPSFSLTVNHRDTYTGVTDRDRSKTIRALGDAAADPEAFDFAAAFRAPGHVQVLKAADGLLDEREGHTELGLALAEATDLPPAVVVCEMLDDETGKALAPADARAYADRNGFAYLEGRDILDHFA